MSYHVYIARAGWGETPITLEEWTRAVSDLPELETRRAQRGDGLIVHLKGVRRQWLRLTQGCVLSQAPEEDLVSIMFHLATRLDARV